jgi:hypothetical protein
MPPDMPIFSKLETIFRVFLPLKGVLKRAPLKGVLKRAPLKGVLKRAPLKGVLKRAPLKGVLKRAAENSFFNALTPFTVIRLCHQVCIV